MTVFLLLFIFGTLVHSFNKTKHRKNMICTRKDHNGKINYLNERKEEKKTLPIVLLAVTVTVAAKKRVRIVLVF